MGILLDSCMLTYICMYVLYMYVCTYLKYDNIWLMYESSIYIYLYLDSQVLERYLMLYTWYEIKPWIVIFNSRAWALLNLLCLFEI